MYGIIDWWVQAEAGGDSALIAMHAKATDVRPDTQNQTAKYLIFPIYNETSINYNLPLSIGHGAETRHHDGRIIRCPSQRRPANIIRWCDTTKTCQN